jgi:hypothetical protein
MVGRTPCMTAPRMLKTSPASQMTRNTTDSPSAEPRRKFSMICGEKTTTQQAIDTDPRMPLMASMSRLSPWGGGYMSHVYQMGEGNMPKKPTGTPGKMQPTKRRIVFLRCGES